MNQCGIHQTKFNQTIKLNVFSFNWIDELVWLMAAALDFIDFCRFILFVNSLFAEFLSLLRQQQSRYQSANSYCRYAFWFQPSFISINLH